MAKPEEEEHEREDDAKKKETKGHIKIPSYQEVFGGGGGGGGGHSSSSSSSKPYNPPPPPSFSQAFSFLKSSEFYTPPPQPEPQPQPPPEDTQRVSATDSRSSVLPPPPASSSSSNFASSSGQNRNAILVSHRQKGNPLLKHIRNVRWMFADIVCDYLLGQGSCALYISLRYHLLHPDYLYYRIRELQKDFKLRVVLCHVDVEDVIKPLHEVTRTALLHDCTLLCGWSFEECARYLETIKVYENKPADSIREQMDTDYLSRLTHALTSIRHVNKTDVVTLGSSFGSLSRIMDASMEELARCPGIGERKVKRLYDTFHEPFRRVSSRPSIAVPETPAEGQALEEPSSILGGVQVVKEMPKASEKGKEKESGLSVTSALSAAFDKYAEKIRTRKRNPVENAEGSSGTASIDDRTSFKTGK
ncbi:DNA excision repair protein ERCC-1 [Ananas comosus]|uniref:DNA excision repair protein ERCC-1 n=1 Tax=Ananas comosus TaxID=4615 RepID=A0A6P5FAS8_ANACO|nr:DNA excision repair protein ERCC-1 [Ananas comosus]